MRKKKYLFIISPKTTKGNKIKNKIGENMRILRYGMQSREKVLIIIQILQAQ